MRSGTQCIAVKQGFQDCISVDQFCYTLALQLLKSRISVACNSFTHFYKLT